MKTTRRSFLAGTAASALLPSWPSFAQPLPRPNIVLILADDLGYGDVSYQHPGSPLQTPNIDALAAAGARYSDAHSPASVCSPTRAGILTGRYTWRSWLKAYVIEPYGSPIIRNQPTIANLLLDSGYQTACVGKWHMGMDWGRFTGDIPKINQRAWPESTIDFRLPITNGPIDLGFQTFFGVDAPNYPPYAFIVDDHIYGAQPTETLAAGPANTAGKKQPGFNIANTFTTTKAWSLARLNRMIERRNADGTPFFMYIPLTAPHLPITPSAAWQGQSSIGPIGDYIMELDAFVGDVRAALAAGGALNNTLLVFASENASPGIVSDGAAVGSTITQYGFNPNYPWKGLKITEDLYEGGHRIPLICHWPDAIAPSTIAQTVCLTDLARTFADVAGVIAPDNFGEDSLSLMPGWLGTDPTHQREAIVHHGIWGRAGIRKGGWKLFEGPNGWELYNLVADPGETTNVVSTNYEKMRELADLLRTIQQDDRSVFPL